MNINSISVEQYFKMSDKEKENFYLQIDKNNPRREKTTYFLTKYNPAKQAKIPPLFHHQSTGKLTYIAPLFRGDKNNSGLYFLVICDCGNWGIIESINYRKECQIQCIQCVITNTTTMKNITGEIYGQLQAIAPTSERAKDGSVYWNCQCIDCGHIQKVVKSNLRKKDGHLCAVCGEKSKGEFKVAKMLKELQIPFEREKVFDDCIFNNTQRKARFDFYVNNQYIIEVDGQHHFTPVVYGGQMTVDEQKQMYLKVLSHDRQKNQYCFKNNIPLIRIPYFALDTLTNEDLYIETSRFLII